jgi:ubiquinol-cytochrome c reductase cytochrome b subunit
VAAMVVHLMRVFFTGAYRRPRELNWVVGVTLLLLAIGNGFFGYSLLDDLLSGTGVRVANAIALSVPVVGSSLAFLLFGGEFPTDAMIPRFFFLHVFVVPAAIAVLLTAHLGMVWRQKHTQFPGPGRTEENIQGSRLWPSYALRSVGLLFLVTAVLAGLGGLAQINPIWLYGPFRTAVSATAVTSASQPDWYMGWLDGALRLWPAWEIRAFGFTIANPFFPGVLLPTVTFGVLYAWPWLAARRTKDVRPTYHLLDRPRDAPVRTAFGAAAFTFFTVLFVAGSNDVIAGATQVPPEDLTWLLRVAAFVLPVLVFVVTMAVCRELQRRPDPHLLRPGPDHVVRRTATGGFAEDPDHGEDRDDAAVDDEGQGAPVSGGTR